MDPQTIRDFVELWFAALDNRQAEILVGMTDPAVVVKPYRARQENEDVEYRGHDGIRHWVDTLDEDLRITLELLDVQVMGSQSALVEADVWFSREGVRTGGLSVSVWRFDDGKLCEAVGYGNRDAALSAEHVPWAKRS